MGADYGFSWQAGGSRGRVHPRVAQGPTRFVFGAFGTSRRPEIRILSSRCRPPGRRVAGAAWTNALRVAVHDRTEGRRVRLSGSAAWFAGVRCAHRADLSLPGDI